MNSKQRRQRRRRDMRLISGLSSIFIDGMRETIEKAKKNDWSSDELRDYVLNDLDELESLMKEIGVNCE